MYKIFILATVLFFSGCTSCSNEKKQKSIESEIEKVESTLTPNDSVDKPLHNNMKLDENVTEKNKKNLQDTIEENETLNIQEIEAEAIHTIYPKIAEETQKIPDCLESAMTKEEAFSCSDALRKLNKDLTLAMSGFIEDDINGFGEDFIWDEETKMKMIQQIEDNIKEIENTQQCLTNSNTPEELKNCLDLQL